MENTIPLQMAEEDKDYEMVVKISFKSGVKAFVIGSVIFFGITVFSVLLGHIYYGIPTPTELISATYLNFFYSHQLPSTSGGFVLIHEFVYSVIPAFLLTVYGNKNIGYLQHVIRHDGERFLSRLRTSIVYGGLVATGYLVLSVVVALIFMGLVDWSTIIFTGIIYPVLFGALGGMIRYFFS